MKNKKYKMKKYDFFILIYKDKKINMKDLNKNLKISTELHKKIKVYCAENSLKINEWVENQLEKIIIENEMDKRKM